MQHKRKTYPFLFSLVALLFAPLLSFAQNIDSIIADFQKEQKQVLFMKNILRDGEEAKSIALIRRLVASGDPTWVELAITEGIKNENKAVRNIAVRAAFINVPTIQIHLLLPDDADAAVRSDYENAQGPRGNNIRSIEYDFSSGLFDGYFASGRVSGESIIFATSRCAGTLSREEESWVFTGQVRCKDSQFVGRARLR